MRVRKSLLRICTFLFLLPSLLLPNWSIGVENAIAQEQGSLPLDFTEHIAYQTYKTNWATRLSWEADVDFFKNSIRAKWIFRVQQAETPDSDNWTLTDEFIQKVPCKKMGDVQILAGKAIFNPVTKDYIKCELPSFRETANVMSYTSAGESIILQRACTECLDPWLAADVQVKPVDTRNKYPIIYLQPMEKVRQPEPAFQSQIERVGAISSPFKLKTSMSGWAQPKWSQPVDVKKQQKYWSGLNPNYFVQTLEERANHPLFTSWIETWVQSPLVPYIQENSYLDSQMWLSWAENNNSYQATSSDQDKQMSTGPMMLYIGHNPGSKEYFSGTMYSVGVDPSCVGY